VPDEDVFALAAVERRRAADMFAGLSDDQITGPGEALALAIGSRAVALGDLAGPGLPARRTRLGWQRLSEQTAQRASGFVGTPDYPGHRPGHPAHLVAGVPGTRPRDEFPWPRTS
jgi:hypothetical protein